MWSQLEFMFYIESIVNSGSIQLSMKPISESFTIDKLMQIYDAFPWVEQNQVEVAMVGSDGSIRYVPCRRKIVIGKQPHTKTESNTVEDIRYSTKVEKT